VGTPNSNDYMRKPAIMGCDDMICTRQGLMGSAKSIHYNMLVIEQSSITSMSDIGFLDYPANSAGALADA
jgi:hypothetical protein